MATFFDTAYPTAPTVDLTAAKDYRMHIPVIKPARVRFPTHQLFAESRFERYLGVTESYSADAYTAVQFKS